jgi:hypothetical protein
MRLGFSNILNRGTMMRNSAVKGVVFVAAVAAALAGFGAPTGPNQRRVGSTP